MKSSIKFPFYVRLTFMVISLIGITYILYMGKSILIPIVMAFLIAVLILPVVDFLNLKLRLPNALSSTIAVMLFASIIMGILVFVSYGISDIGKDFIEIKKNINLFIMDVQRYIRANFNISVWEQQKYIENVTQDSLKKGTGAIGTTILSFANLILDLTLIPIYTFLILLYRTHFMVFLAKLFKSKYHTKLQEILIQIKGSVQSYISGLIFEMIAVSILTSIGLYFVGVKYAILLGIITGILNLIPYLGILLAGILTILSSFTGTPEISQVLGVIIVNVIVQILDNNVLVPLIINTKVQINAFVSIIGIIVGGQLGGIAGMFLAIPILAIIKLIFDKIDDLEPWGYVMGDNVPKVFQWKYKSKIIK